MNKEEWLLIAVINECKKHLKRMRPMQLIN